MRRELAPLCNSTAVQASRQPIRLVRVNVDGNKTLVPEEEVSSDQIKEWLTSTASARRLLFERHSVSNKPTHMLLFTFPPAVQPVPVQAVQAVQQGFWLNYWYP